MKAAELRGEIAVELLSIGGVVEELLALQHDLASRGPTVREKTAAAAFLAQFYNGIENILKRISSYYEIELPIGETWHVDLFDRFCAPPQPPLPSLFDVSLASGLAPYRRFRHVVFQSYGTELDWNRMAEGVAGVRDVYVRVRTSLSAYLDTLRDS